VAYKQNIKLGTDRFYSENLSISNFDQDIYFWS